MNLEQIDTSTTAGSISLCPFCGDWGAECADSSVPSIHGGQKKAVYCNTCFCEGPTSETEAGAIEAWNRRADLAGEVANVND